MKTGYGFLLSILLLFGCSAAPEKQKVVHDFEQLFSQKVGEGMQSIIISVVPGEGDADNIYEHVKFDVVAQKDIVIKKDWFEGMSFNKGDRLYGGEVVILYQKNKDAHWSPTRHNLQRKPSAKSQ